MPKCQKEILYRKVPAPKVALEYTLKSCMMILKKKCRLKNVQNKMFEFVNLDSVSENFINAVFISLKYLL